jgi:hypothetical protein
MDCPWLAWRRKFNDRDLTAQFNEREFLLKLRDRIDLGIGC